MSGTINPYDKKKMVPQLLGGRGSTNTARSENGAAVASTVSTSSPKKDPPDNANIESSSSTASAGKSNISGVISGLAPSTKAGNESAEKLAAIFRQIMGYAPTMHAGEFQEDNLRMYIGRYFRWLSERLIPTYFNDELKLSNPSNKKCCTTETLLSYVGKHLTRICTKFKPDDYNGLKPTEHPEWYTLLRKHFAAACERFHVITVGAGDDVEFGDLDTRALYREIENSSTDDPLSECDLVHWFTNCYRDISAGSSAMEVAAWIFTTSDSVARGGEVKFQVFKEWDFDHFLKVTNTGWTESKTCNYYAMARVPDKMWCFCFYFHMAAYFMCCNGLYRTQEQIEKSLSKVVFPSLYNIGDASVARKLTVGVRKYLPVSLRKELRDSFSSRSLRLGPITELTMHPEVTLFQLCAWSGHSTGTTLDSYIDKKNVAKTIPAANALHQRVRVLAKVVVPRLDSLGEDVQEQVKLLMDFMFPVVSIADFHQGQPLYPVLKICVASIIMHNPQVESDCTVQNKVSSMLRHAAEKAKISDTTVPTVLGPQAVLNCWSTTIKKDFEQQLNSSAIESIASQPGPMQLVCNLLMENHNELKGVREDLKRLRNEMKDVMMESAATIATNVVQKIDIQQLSLRLEKAEKKVALLRTPPSPQRLPKSPTYHSPAIDPGQGSPEHQSSSESDVYPTLASSAMAHHIPPPPLNLRNSFASAKVADKNSAGKNKGEGLASVLINMSRDKQLQNPIVNSTIPPDFDKNKSYLRNCLELVEYAGDCDDVKTLVNSADGKEVSDAAHRLESACLKKMLDFEEDVGGGKPKKALILGLGNRVRAYKKLIGEAMNTKEPQLMELSELREHQSNQAPGTPKGNKSIATFCVSKKRKSSDL